jgi:hypothetical protein
LRTSKADPRLCRSSPASLQGANPLLALTAVDMAKRQTAQKKEWTFQTFFAVKTFGLGECDAVVINWRNQ